MAPNPMRGEAALGSFTLVFDFNAMCTLERATGLKTAQLLELMQSGEMGFDDVRHFAFAGLQAEHPGTTLLEAGDAVGSVGVEPALEAISESLRLCFSSGSKAKDENPLPAA